jgi:hypothetical protein
MTPKLCQHPLADDRVLGGVVKNVNFPEAPENFACQ